jgi:hypothetical protein
MSTSTKTDIKAIVFNLTKRFQKWVIFEDSWLMVIPLN